MDHWRSGSIFTDNPVSGRGAMAFSLVLCLTMSACSAESLNSSEVFTSQQHRFQVVPLVEGLEHPWGLAFLPDGRMLVTERPGRLRLVEGDRLSPEAITGLPDNIAVQGQGGLLDVAAHPGFSDNGLVYLSYAGSGPGGAGTDVVRGRLDGMTLSDVEVIFRALPKSSGGRHFGSRLLFNPGGHLFISLGDRGDRANGQDLGTHAGSLIRLDPDGGVPADNPFVGQSGAMPEIYTYGNRNMQGMALRPDDGSIWTQEHGPRGGDEVNRMLAGANYGWPEVTYGKNYSGTTITNETSRPGMEDPVYYWMPSIAPSGMLFYDGNAFPEWRGDLFVGALKAQLLARLKMDGDRVVAEERLLEGQFGRIRDVRQGPDGLIYLLTDDSNGKLLRLQPVD